MPVLTIGTLSLIGVPWWLQIAAAVVSAVVIVLATWIIAGVTTEELERHGGHGDDATKSQEG